MNTLKNLAKKAVAVGSGMLAIGATVAGAAALDLKDYPAPFIQNGQFNGLIVVGEKAMPADILGAIEIAASLQASSTSAASGSSGSTTSLSGDVRKIGESSDLLEIGEDFGDVTETLTEDDLMFLKGGIVSTDEGDTDFVQTIDLDLTRTGSSGSVGLFEDNNDDVGTYFYFNDGDDLFTYELEFTSGLESDVEDGRAVDLEDESLFMLGQYFSVVRTDISATGENVKLELIAGDITDTLREGEVKTYTVNGKQYEVTLIAVSDNQNPVTAKFLVNGESTDSMEEGETDKVAGLDIGVRELLANEGTEAAGADLAEFYLGANKLELQDNDITTGASTIRPKINGETIEDATVTISGTENVASSDGDITLSRISYTLRGDAKSGDQDVYLKKGEGLRAYLDEPAGMLADGWDITFQGLSSPDMTNIEFTAQGDDQYDLMFTNVRGVEFSVPLYYAGDATDNNGNFGDEDDSLVWAEINAGANATTVPGDTGDFLIGVDDYFIVTDQGSAAQADNGDVTYVLQWNDVDTSENTLTFQTAGEGKEVKARWDSGAGTLADPYTGDILIGGKNFNFWYVTSGNRLAVDLDNSGGYATSGSATPDLVDVVVKGGGVIELDSNTVSDGQFVLTLTTQADDMDNDVDQTSTISFDETNDEVQAQFAVGSGTWFSESPRGEDRDVHLNRYGTMVDEEDETDESNTVIIQYPSSQVEALVYVTGGEVQSTTMAGGAGVVVNPIRVGTAKLDSDVRADQANMIVVGGPCVNTVAAGLLNNPANCAEGFVEGTAMLKMFDTGNNVALLVAGYGAQDTQAASRALAQYRDNKFMGDEVELAVTSAERYTIR